MRGDSWTETWSRGWILENSDMIWFTKENHTILRRKISGNMHGKVATETEWETSENLTLEF